MNAATLAPAADALAVYDAALRRAARGDRVRLTLYDDRGAGHVVDPGAWCRTRLPGDGGLLARCAGPTLDVGCGPGRLAGALARAGVPVLGVDLSPTAVALTRGRGAAALRRDVFGPVPGTGRWRHVLLADGNVGIGGDPGALLARCGALLARGGRLHVELAAPGRRSWAGRAALRAGDGPAAPLRWAAVAAGDLAAEAARAALRVTHTWTEAGRWFATLAR